jgi:hypothetical protein
MTASNFPLLDEFTLSPKQRTRLIEQYQKDEDLETMFAKAESFSEINIRSVNAKTGIKHYTPENISEEVYNLLFESNF